MSDIFNTKRLIIEFDGLKIGADIEPGVTLSAALREIANTQEQLGNGDFEEIEEID